MKFYEFNTDRFGYYALIGASTSDVAIEYYEEVIGELYEDEKESIPVEISKDDARNKLIEICKDNKEKQEALEQFNKNINDGEPYLILMDGSLL
jgi:dsRNA-specific ribonuclease